MKGDPAPQGRGDPVPHGRGDPTPHGGDPTPHGGDPEPHGRGDPALHGEGDPVPHEGDPAPHGGGDSVPHGEGDPAPQRRGAEETGRRQEAGRGPVSTEGATGNWSPSATLVTAILTGRAQWSTWGDFPGGPVVKTPSFHGKGSGSIPAQGTKIPKAARGSQEKKRETLARSKGGFLSFLWVLMSITS